MSLPNLFAVAGIALWLCYEILLRSRDPSTLSWRAGDGDRGSTYLLIGCYVLIGVLATVFHSMAAGHIHQRWRWAGVVVIGFGLLLRAWGMRTLGTAFARTLRIDRRRSLIRSGPYRLIRHPGYSGSLLVWIGYGAGIGNWLIAALTAALLLAAYTWRISAEERLLADAFGDEYTDYRRHTKKLVPFLY